MLLNVCIGKIHRATVTDADLNYVGSITIDKKLLDAAGIFEGQMVQITNLSNAMLWRTYVLEGPAGKGDIILNGPPARFFQKGDKVVILAEAYVEEKIAKSMRPTVVFVDEKNAIIEIEKGKR